MIAADVHAKMTGAIGIQHFLEFRLKELGCTEMIEKDFRGSRSNQGNFQTCINKAGYRATEVTCGWAGAVIKRLTCVFGREQ